MSVAMHEMHVGRMCRCIRSSPHDTNAAAAAYSLCMHGIGGLLCINMSLVNEPHFFSALHGEYDLELLN